MLFDAIAAQMATKLTGRPIHAALGVRRRRAAR
jgi:hypothetical protein